MGQVGQGAEIMNMVGNLQDAGLVVDEKLDMIIEHLRKQEEHTARLELRLAEYSECMAEVCRVCCFCLLSCRGSWVG